MQLILFPYAGGAGPAYRSLTEHLPADWNIHTLHLPGRGQRIQEPLCQDISEMVDDLMVQLKEIEDPCGFFGHSMGAILAYLTALNLSREERRMPDFLICSGCQALHLPWRKQLRHNLESKAFRGHLKDMGGVPDQIIEDAELMDFFEPIIRTDYKISETFQLDDPTELPIPMYTFFGRNEDLNEEEKREWSRLCHHPVIRSDFEGPHFFIFSKPKEVAARIQVIAYSFDNKVGYL